MAKKSTGWSAVVAPAVLLAMGVFARGQLGDPLRPWGPAPDGGTTRGAGAGVADHSGTSGMPATTAASAPAGPRPVNDAEITAAMKRGVDYLLTHEKGGNNWESGRKWIENGQIGGETALAMYALLNAGESLHDDPVYGPKLMYRSDAMAGAVKYLCNLEAAETYVAALQACALAHVPREADNKKPGTPEAALERAQKFLISAMGPTGGYSYLPPKTRMTAQGGQIVSYGDLSNAQYGALGMWALEDAGLKAPLTYWQATDRFWRATQRVDGSWPYAGNLEPLASTRDTMGIAGIATLFISQEFTDKTIRGTPKPDQNISDGLNWLDSRFRADTGDLYYMYGVERVGLASGLRFFGKTDWYRTCAADIIAHQNDNGSWDQTSWMQDGPGGGRSVDGRRLSSDDGGFTGANGTTATSFALLFLARGRNPVLFNKLQYDGPWNARPMDDAFATRWVSHKLERPLNWHVVNMQVSGRDWLDAPVLLITGSKDPKFTPADLEKFRAYIEGGGMIFSSADQGDAAFTNAIKKYAAATLGGKYDMRTLPANHVLFSKELNSAMTSPPQLLGMSNGVREVWVHSPVDVAASWQLQRTTSTAHFETAASIYFYVSGRGNLDGGLKALDNNDPAAAAPERSVAVGRVSYAGNWDPEPGAWDAFAAWARGQGKEKGFDLKTTPVALKELNPDKYPIVHITGTAKIPIKPDECEVLRRYVQGGGVVIADASGGGAGGSDFLDSFVGMTQIAFPGSNKTPLAPGHAIYTGKFADAAGGTPAVPAGDDVQQVLFRRYGELVLKQKVTEPTIEAIDINGKPRIFLSKYDLTTGLLGIETWGITGYEPASARGLMANILRFAASGSK